jgi:hypothetical protein
MPIRARIAQSKADALRAQKRIESLLVEVERSLDIIEARLLNLRNSNIRKRQVRYYA